MRPLHTKVLTPMDATIAAGGGIVIAQIPSDDWEQEPSTASWRVRAAGHELSASSRKNIAPGLELFDIGDIAGEVRLESDKHDVLVRAFASDKVADLAAPQVRSVVYGSSGGRRPVMTITAAFTAKAPAHAIALVAFGEDGTARSFGLVKPGDTGVVIFSSGGCQTQPAGIVMSSPGQEIQLAWVADSGRLSKKSPKIQITARR